MKTCVIRYTQDYVFQTRNGSSFSPFSHPIQAPTHFDFAEPLRKAIERAEDIEWDALEGYPIEPLIEVVASPHHTPFSSSTPLDPNLDSIEPNHCSAPPPHISPTFQSQPSTSKQPTPGSIEKQRRKANGHLKQRTKRRAAKGVALYGEYAVKPNALRHVVRPATPIKTTLKTEQLPHTKGGYTGGRAVGGPDKKVYEIYELVGEDSTEGFDLREWDGRSV